MPKVFVSVACMCLPPKCKSIKETNPSICQLCNTITINVFFLLLLFFAIHLAVSRISKQAELQLFSPQDDKCLHSVFLLALPAHHINQMCSKRGDRDTMMTFGFPNENVSFQICSCSLSPEVSRLLWVLGEYATQLGGQ